THVRKTAAECSIEAHGNCLPQAAEITNHRHRRLLCSRRERPRRRAAKQRDEGAAFHVWHGLSSLPFWREPMSYSTSRSACRRALLGADLNRSEWRELLLAPERAKVRL